jgi:transcriptional regulator with XRE-family HTH domain
MQWRQEDLAKRAGVPRGSVSRIETGDADVVTLGALRRITAALDARLLLDVQWRGAELDRLLDARHAALQEWFAAYLRRIGWEVRVEVSFNVYGDRGRYDLLAFHRTSNALLAVEVKTSVGDIQELLGKLDVKVRVAPRVARDLGWQPSRVVPALVLADSSTVRRHVQAHAALFARFAMGHRTAASWLRQPEATIERPEALIIFRKLPYAHHGDTIRVRPRRKTQPRAAAADEPSSRSRAG